MVQSGDLGLTESQVRGSAAVLLQWDTINWVMCKEQSDPSQLWKQVSLRGRCWQVQSLLGFHSKVSQLALLPYPLEESSEGQHS